MKSIINIASIMVITIFSSALQAQTLEESIASAYAQIDTAKTSSEMMAALASFEIIANKWNNEWAANYYAAYSKAIYSFAEADNNKKDLLLSKADLYLEKAKELQPQKDETFILAALITNARIAVDGQNRGRKYGPLFMQLLEEAKAINPNNPRIYYLKGTSLFYTPKMFGGGQKKAKPYFEKAKGLFSKEEKTSVLKPYWGEQQNTDYLKQCE